MILALLFFGICLAGVVWLVWTLHAIRRNTGRTVELLERAQRAPAQWPVE